MTLAQRIRAACLLEATALKPGNVHPAASFPDLCHADFVQAAWGASPALASAHELGVGRAIYEAVAATRRVTRSNPNLGIALLLAPLAAVPLHVSLAQGIPDVLSALTVEDARWAYQAIRLARPGGLGEAAAEDIREEPTGTLLEAMRLAEDRDLIAAQYATQFALVLAAAKNLRQHAAECFVTSWNEVIIEQQLRLLAAHPDSLIARKCGPDVAAEASRRAEAVLQCTGLRFLVESGAGTGENVAAHPALVDFDRWLRSAGNRRNPGTTADLIAAILFAALRDGELPLPSQFR